MKATPPTANNNQCKQIWWYKTLIASLLESPHSFFFISTVQHSTIQLEATNQTTTIFHHVYDLWYVIWCDVDWTSGCRVCQVESQSVNFKTCHFSTKNAKMLHQSEEVASPTLPNFHHEETDTMEAMHVWNGMGRSEIGWIWEWFHSTFQNHSIQLEIEMIRFYASLHFGWNFDPILHHDNDRFTWRWNCRWDIHGDLSGMKKIVGHHLIFENVVWL